MACTMRRACAGALALVVCALSPSLAHAQGQWGDGSGLIALWGVACAAALIGPLVVSGGALLLNRATRGRFGWLAQLVGVGELFAGLAVAIGILSFLDWPTVRGAEDLLFNLIAVSPGLGAALIGAGTLAWARRQSGAS